MAKKITLTQGKVALIDNKDFEWLNKYKWHATKDRNTFYAERRVRVRGKKSPIAILMHRIITNVLSGLTVDHIDGNGLNNQRNNLRICDQASNTRNRKIQKGTSKFKGVLI